jgi:hypothetical protein
MQIEQLGAHLQEPLDLEALCEGWQESAASLPAGLPTFLDPAEIRANRAWAHLPATLDPQLSALAARIAADPALLALAWHTWKRLSGPQDGARLAEWPNLAPVLGDESGAFYLLVALAAVPRIRAEHSALGIPEDVTRDTCQVLWCLNYNYGRQHPNRPGILRKELYWLRYHLTGKLFRLGRFEYMLRPFIGRLRAYRNRATGQVVALAEDGQCYTPQGYMQTSDVPDNTACTDGWRAALQQSAEQVSGSPISPLGAALQRQVTLALSEWTCVLAPEQTAIDMHIPEGGQMTPDASRDSFRRAFAFFEAHFPERPASAVQCHSWIFGPQLERILPASANLVRLQREVYLFPVRHGRNEGLYYTLGADEFDPESAPRDTSLQRAIGGYLAAGGVWRCGGMFLMREDLARYGGGFYRSDWPHQP